MRAISASALVVLVLVACAPAGRRADPDLAPAPAWRIAPEPEPRQPSKAEVEDARAARMAAIRDVKNAGLLCGGPAPLLLWLATWVSAGRDAVAELVPEPREAPPIEHTLVAADRVVATLVACR